MTDPIHVTAAASAATQATSAASSATFAAAASALNIVLWPFSLTFFFACCALIYLDRMSPTSAFKSVIGSTLIGGALAQLIAEPALLIFSGLFPATHDWAITDKAHITVVALLAIAAGLLCQKAVPVLFRRTEALGEK